MVYFLGNKKIIDVAKHLFEDCAKEIKLRMKRTETMQMKHGIGYLLFAVLIKSTKETQGIYFEL